MATNYTTLLGFALPTTGELSGTWGNVVNSSITELVEDAIAGTVIVDVTSSDWTLSTTGAGNVNQARSAILIPTGTPGVSRNIIAPGASKAYIIDNQSDAAVVVKASATTGCTINAGRSALVAWDGSDFVLISDDLSAPPPIGNVTPNTGAFTTLAATTGNITTVNATTVDTTNLEVTNLKAKDGTAAGSIANSTGVVTVASAVLTTADINGGTVDNSIIGGATPAAGTFTDLVANTDLTINNTTTVDGILDEDTMASNSATKLATQQSIKAYVDSQVATVDTLEEVLANGNTTGANNIVVSSGQEITTNTISETTLGSGVTIDSVLLKDDVVNATDVEVGSISASDGTQAATIANATGVLTVASSVLTTTDINGGTIDSTTIGATTRSTGAFTTLDSNSTTTLNGTTIPASKTLVDTNSTQTLTNKTVSVDSNTVSGIAASSFVLSNASGNVDGAAAQKAIPSGVVVGTTDAQTLTNKTLTAPVINSPTGIVKGDVGLGNVDNTSDATKNSATATLTNKTLTAPVINSPTGLVKADVGLGNVDNTSDATKNSATATLTNKTIAFASNTLTDVASTNTAQTLTNKTLTAPVINSPTGIVKGDVGLGNVDNTSDATKNSATATLTNKSINLANNTLTATSAQVAAAVSDETGTGSLVFAGSPALTGTPTTPTAAAGTNTTQVASTAHVFAERTNTATLTNKTLTSPTVNTPTVSGGTINNASVGASVPSTGDFTVLTENDSPAVVQTDIGTAPNEIPLNQYLGSMAYQDDANVTINGGVATLSTATISTIQNDTAISNVEPSLMLNFAQVKKLDPRITFARASSATYYGTQTAKAEENLLLYSQEFDNGVWTKQRASVTANSDTAPDGTTTADALTQTAGQTTFGNAVQTVNVTADDYVMSVFAKPNGKNFIVLQEQISDGGLNRTWFNVSTGAVGTTFAGHTATIEPSTNGYYRCSIVFTVNATRTSTANGFGLADTDGSTTVTDSGGLYLWGAQVEQRSAVSSYTPTTTQPITNYQPQLLTASANVARFDHNPLTLESLGLLVEEQRTNLLVRSEEFSNAAWIKDSCTASANATIAPDGALTATRLIPNSGSLINSRLRQGFTYTAQRYTYTIYAKKDGDYLYYAVASSSVFNPPPSVYVDLTDGSVLQSTNAITKVTSVGNGWYRISIAPTTNAVAGTSSFGIVHSAADTVGSAAVTGDGYSGFYIWGAQLEAGAFPTSYIPTVASQVTRSADSASMTGTNFSSWYRQDEGTLYGEASKPYLMGAGNFNNLIAISDNTTSNTHLIYGNGTSQTIDLAGSTNGISQYFFNSGVFVANTNYKICLATQTNNIGQTRNGSTVNTDSVAILPITNRLYIGVGASGNAQWNGHIKKLSYYPARLSDAELQEMTEQ